MQSIDTRYQRAIAAIGWVLSVKTPLMWQHNMRMAGALAELIRGEIDEAVAAREVWESTTDPYQKQKLREKLADEHGDVLIFLATLMHMRHPALADTQTRLFSVNGDGGRSSIYDRLRQLAPELHDDPAAVKQFLALLQSADAHGPVPWSAIETILRTIEKVLANYPPAFMTTLGSDGRLLSEEEQERKFAFLRLVLRMIRNHVNKGGERALRLTDYSTLLEVIVFGYDHPHAALQVIHTYLESLANPERAQEGLRVLRLAPMPDTSSRTDHTPCKISGYETSS